MRAQNSAKASIAVIVEDLGFNDITKRLNKCKQQYRGVRFESLEGVTSWDQVVLPKWWPVLGYTVVSVHKRGRQGQ